MLRVGLADKTVGQHMKHDAKMLNWIDRRASTMREQVERWCAINTHTENLAGIAQLSDAVAQTFASLGEFERIALPTYEVVNDDGQAVACKAAPAMSLRVRPNAEIQALLVIHLDTVYPLAQHAGLHDDDDDTLRAPGAADAKGGLCVMLNALQAFEQCAASEALGYRVILNTDEEIGSPASAALLTQAAKQAHVGLVFEPALPDGNLIGARKGSGNLTVIVRGQSAHAGREIENGRNAVVAASRLATQLHAMNCPEEGVTLNVARMVGGGATNVVPDLCVLRFNLRVLDQAQQRSAMQAIEQHVASLHQNSDCSASLQGAFHNPPKPTNLALQTMLDHVQSVGQSLGMKLSHQPSGGVCDGNKLAGAGLATVDTLGAVGGHIHSPQEYVKISSLTQRAKLTAALLHAYASRELMLPQQTETR